MKGIKYLAVALCFQILFSNTQCCFADSEGIKQIAEDNTVNVLQYFGMTYNEILMERSGLYKAIDSFGSGKEFLTDGRIDFYFDYCYSDDIYDAAVNRIVITNNDFGRSFVGENMCIPATYNDEILYMEANGFENVCTLGDLRKVWVSDDYIAIVSRGPYSGCCEIDISKNAEGMY